MNLLDKNKEQFSSGSVLLENELMSKHSTWRCGGRANLFFQPKTKKDVSIFLQSYGSPIKLLGSVLAVTRYL